MKTRNSPKTAPPKKTPVKKSPLKPELDTPSPSAATPHPASPPKIGGATTKSAKVEDASASGETAAKATQETKPKTVTKTVMKKVLRKVVKPTAKAAVAKPQKSAEVAVEEPVAPVKVEETPKEEEPVAANTDDDNTKKEEVSGCVDESLKKEESVAMSVDDEALDEKETVVENAEKEEVPNTSSVETLEKVESEIVAVKEEEQVEKEEDVEEAGNETKDSEGEPDDMEQDVEEDVEGTQVQLDEEEDNVDDEPEGFEEPGDEECAEDDASEPEEENAKGSEEEDREISALAKERKSKKEQEIFVGGLDRDTVEDDIWKAFESIGEVIEVRLHRNQSTNKNKGYAFVKFANKEQASKALSELKNPLIRGKRCGVAPSEDNDTLFVGNICNTWTKEAIKKKLKEYGLEGVENITLVSDAQREGLSRGFAFVEFSCHADAMLAYKRLQKPDAVFGHAERSVKVAFAEPLRDPDPEIMAQVKSVFIDGLPPSWDEERVREHFKPYGEIERVVLARNMPSAKRKDFGFVDFTTHEAAMACISGLNGTDLGDSKSKSKVKVRLSNPLPKTQAVKGGLCGGFRIGRPGSGFSRFGKGLGQGGRPFNRDNVPRGKDSYSHARGRDRTGKLSFADEDIREGPYSGNRGRQPFGGRVGGRRGYEEYPPRAGTSSRHEIARPTYGAMERGRGRSTLPRRQPYPQEARYSRPMADRHYVDDPYAYDDYRYGSKRPYSMLDHEPGYLEPNRLRPRFDHPDPIIPSRETRYQDTYGAERGLYSPDYYGPAPYGGGAYSSMYGGDGSYGGGYYY